MTKRENAIIRAQVNQTIGQAVHAAYKGESEKALAIWKATLLIAIPLIGWSGIHEITQAKVYPRNMTIDCFFHKMHLPEHEIEKYFLSTP